MIREIFSRKFLADEAEPVLKVRKPIDRPRLAGYANWAAVCELAMMSIFIIAA